MPETNLVLVCCVAGLAVFVVLGFLAGVIHGLNQLFPPKAEALDTLDPVLVTVVSEAVQSAYPGTRVTRIEELR